MMKLHLSPAGALAPVLALSVALSLPATPAFAQQDGGLFGNLFKPPGSVPAAQQQEADESAGLVVRLEQMENALRRLTGQVEELQYRNAQLEAQLRMVQEKLGLKPATPSASGMVGGEAVVPAASAAGGGNTGAAARRSDAFDPQGSRVAPGAPHPLGSPASSSEGLAAPGAHAEVGAVPADGRNVAGAGSARELYDAGVKALQDGRLEEAEALFRQILTSNADDRLVPDALFMVGESLFLRKHYSDAAASFLDVSTKYPNSTRAPEALLRLGQSLAGMGEKETACATFQEVGRKYPRAPSSVRQAVEREQKRVGC
ncbi:tol-pal system protein YbgF [Xanthobacter sp. TB0139]|uniref:tol-pal system protein YbgF n=1 Tax=Xanthobacter sp. TB0139 TaxID=3459178 RepID=UPI004039EF9F